jgi:DNA-binding beta-propeller fold protein YncE
VLLQIRRLPSDGVAAGRRRWLAAARLAVVACLLAATAFDVKAFLYGDTPVIRAGVSPSAVVVSPDGRTVYLANSDDSITPVSAGTGRAGRRIAIRYGSPGRQAGTDTLAITPDGRTLFTTVTDDVTQASLALARVDLRTGRETARVQVPGGVDQFVLTRDGRTLYVLSGDSVLYPVDVATGRVGKALAAPDYVLESAVTMLLSPDGGTLWIATNEDGPDASDVLSGAVTPVSTRTGTAGASVKVGWTPAALAITPDGRTLYAAIDGLSGIGQLAPNAVDVIDTATGRLRATLRWQVAPVYLLMAPDGKTVWAVSVVHDRISMAENTITAIDVASGRPGPSFHPSGWLNSYADRPAGVAMSPDGYSLYLTVPSGLERLRLA